jgi:hypothetical protein
MKIFMREEVTSDWRKLADDLLYDSLSLSYNIRVIKLRSMKWGSYVQICDESKMHIKFY